MTRWGCVLSLVVFGMVGCQRQAPAYVQSTCPFISSSPIDLSLYRDVDGVRIFTCCESCLEEVGLDPQGAVQRLSKRGVRPLSLVEAAEWDRDGSLPDWALENGSVLWQKP